MSIEEDAQRSIAKLEGYRGILEVNGVLILCEAMAVLLRLALNIYIQGKRRDN